MVYSTKCFLLNFAIFSDYSRVNCSYCCIVLQMAKEQLVLAFHKAELGAWLKKPIEQDQFDLDDTMVNNHQ